MSASTLVISLGWFFLVLNHAWPSKKWGGIPIKIMFASLGLGLFVAYTIYTFLK